MPNLDTPVRCRNIESWATVKVIFLTESSHTLNMGIQIIDDGNAGIEKYVALAKKDVWRLRYWRTDEFTVKRKCWWFLLKNISKLKNTNMMQLNIYINWRKRKYSSIYLPFEKFPAKTPLTDFQELYDWILI